MTRRWSSLSPKSARATCRFMSRRCRFSRRPITRHGRSTNRRSRPRSDRGRTRSASSRPIATSNSSGSRTGGARIFRSAAAISISTSCVSSSTATATSPSKGFTGKNYLYREEFTSRIWATRYDFPAVKDGRVKREVLPDDSPAGRAGLVHEHPPQAIQGSARARGADPCVRFRMDQQDRHVRRLCAHRFAVPEFGHGGDGPPSPEELKLLEPFRGKVPDEVFGEPFVPPVSDGSGRTAPCCARPRNCSPTPASSSRTASGCCRTAMSSKSNSCSTSPRSSRTTRRSSRISARSASRRRCGWSMPCSIRARVEDFDFDMTIERFSMSATPGDSMRPFFSSQAAATKGSYNLAGIADPVIDALIEKIIWPSIPAPN